MVRLCYFRCFKPLRDSLVTVAMNPGELISSTAQLCEIYCWKASSSHEYVFSKIIEHTGFVRTRVKRKLLGNAARRTAGDRLRVNVVMFVVFLVFI